MVSCLPRRTAVQEEIWFWYRTATIHAGCSSRFAASRVWPPPIVIQFEDTGPTGLPPVEVSGPTGPPRRSHARGTGTWEVCRNVRSLDA